MLAKENSDSKKKLRIAIQKLDIAQYPTVTYFGCPLDKDVLGESMAFNVIKNQYQTQIFE